MGDKDHCLLFNQRFEGDLAALRDAGIGVWSGVLPLPLFGLQNKADFTGKGRGPFVEWASVDFAIN